MSPRAATTRRAVAVLSAALLGGCVSPGPRPEPPLPLAGPAVAGGAGGAMPQVSPEWWHGFGDPQLDALVEEALAANPSLAQARARLDAAAAAAEGVGDPWRPSLDATAAVTRERLSANGFYPPPIGGETITDAQLGLRLNWDLDLWGRQRAALDAAELRRRAAEIDLADARLTLSTAVTRGYVDLARAYRVLDTAEASRASRASVLELTQNRRRAGLDTDLEVETARGSLAAADGDVAQAQETINLLRHQLAALAGAGPGRGATLTRPTLAPAPDLGSLDPLPADLVARRPDVAASALRIAAAARDINAARTAFYPNINLAATLGLDTIHLSRLIDGSNRAWSVGPALDLPLYGLAQRRGNLHGADARYAELVASYNAAVLEAFHQVADQVESLRDLGPQERAANESLHSLERAFDLATLRYQSGLADYLSVLIAQDRLLAEQRRVVDIEARRAELTVALIRALGGGYGS